MPTTITKDLGEVATSHNLPNHRGGCYNLHGHNYRFEATLIGEPHQHRLNDESSVAPYEGMLVDFTVIKNIFKARIHDKIDHAHMLGTDLPRWYAEFVTLLTNSSAAHAANDTRSNEQFAMDYVDALLGKVAHLPVPETTAEYIAQWAFGELQAGLQAWLIANWADPTKPQPRISSVRVYETSTSYATFYG